MQTLAKVSVQLSTIECTHLNIFIWGAFCKLFGTLLLLIGRTIECSLAAKVSHPQLTISVIWHTQEWRQQQNANQLPCLVCHTSIRQWSTSKQHKEKLSFSLSTTFNTSVWRAFTSNVLVARDQCFCFKTIGLWKSPMRAILWLLRMRKHKLLLCN
jgi:hypothetical protein